MARYAERLKKDIERWTGEGLIDAATATRLTTDVDAKAVSRISFTTVFSMMAAILLGAALLLLVAANWEAMPRLLRVALLLTLILVGYVGGAVLKLRGHGAFGEAAYLLAAIAFGGSIALIAQMYHLSGEEADAILTWFFGSVLAAVLLRSPTLTIGAVILSAVWLAMSIDYRRLLAADTLLVAGGLPAASGSFPFDGMRRRQHLSLARAGLLHLGDLLQSRDP